MTLRTTLPVLLALIATIASAATPLELPLLPGERWWGGWSVDGPLMPFDARTQLSRTLYGNDGTRHRRGRQSSAGGTARARASISPTPRQLDTLRREIGVEGFKFDAGDAEFYTGRILSHAPALPNEHTERFGRVGLDFPLNAKIDQELIVRSAQVHALMPMMQFSVAPWRILVPFTRKSGLGSKPLHLSRESIRLRRVRTKAVGPRNGRTTWMQMCRLVSV